jgi:hypothetical protein
MADSPGLFKYAVVKIDAVDATTALLTGDAPIQQMRTLVPDGVISDVDSAIYSFQLAGPQGTALYTALVAAEGESVEVIFQAEHGVGKTVATFDAIVPVLPLGGQQGAWRTFDITLPVSGAVAKTVSA